MSRLIQALRLILADARHERGILLCEALALAAVLVPLMVLLGLRVGIIGTLINRMDRDPAMRLILPEVTGANRFDEAWFDRWRARPDVAFLLPNTRAIAAQVDIVSGQGESLRIALNPTAPGDPLEVGEAVTDPSAMALTTEAARRLVVTVGDTVTMMLERTRNGRVEPLALPMRVAALVPAEKASAPGGYVILSRLLDLQAFRDGFSVVSLSVSDGNGATPTVSAYPLFRLYVRSIRDVATVAEALRADGVQPSTREGEIASALRLDASLRAVLGIIVGFAAIGVAVSMIAAQLASLRRKRRDLAVLKLIGYGPGWLAILPVGHVVAVVGLGHIFASIGYGMAAVVINRFFADSLTNGEAACSLPLELAVTLGVATLLVTLPAGLIAGVQAARVDPAEEIRDV